MNPREFSSVELFTGAGGLALGLESAHWRHRALVERNQHACDTIRLNSARGHALAKDWLLVQSDVRDIRYSEYGSGIDMVAGGPPCQPFSLGGKHGAFRDDRDMFPEAVRAIRELQPKCFAFENVKGLMRQSFASYFNYIILQLTYPFVTRGSHEAWETHLSRLERHHTAGKVNELSYRVIYRLLNAADYGVPQHRHRVFMVGIRSDLGQEWSFPKPSHFEDNLLWDQWVTGMYWSDHQVPKKERPEMPQRFRSRVDQLRCDYSLLAPPGLRYRTVRDALKGVPDPRHQDGGFFNHHFRDGARPYPGHTGSDLDAPSKALKAGDHGVPGGENMIALPGRMYRYYTAREAARMQTFPDDYIFSGSWSEAMRQIGNAVPVDLAAAVGLSLREQMALS